jgi:hypothetical protein
MKTDSKPSLNKLPAWTRLDCHDFFLKIGGATTHSANTTACYSSFSTIIEQTSNEDELNKPTTTIKI